MLCAAWFYGVFFYMLRSASAFSRYRDILENILMNGMSMCIEVISLLISFGSLIVAFLTFLDKRNSKKIRVSKGTFGNICRYIAQKSTCCRLRRMDFLHVPASSYHITRIAGWKAEHKKILSDCARTAMHSFCATFRLLF